MINPTNPTARAVPKIAPQALVLFLDFLSMCVKPLFSVLFPESPALTLVLRLVVLVVDVGVEVELVIVVVEVEVELTWGGPGMCSVVEEV